MRFSLQVVAKHDHDSYIIVIIIDILSKNCWQSNLSFTLFALCLFSVFLANKLPSKCREEETKQRGQLI